MRIPNIEFEEIDQTFSDAINNASVIAKCIEYIDVKRQELVDYADLWDRANAIWEVHGVNESTISLLAAICSIPSRISRKQLELLSVKFDLKNIFLKDEELAEELFFALQSSVQAYYFDQKRGHMTKALLKKIVKMLTIACDAFGFGIQPHGLVTVIRIFENSGVDGICLESYRSDEVYDAAEYGYYDSEKNEIYYDEFWSTIKIEDLINN